jgi:hypothetical protein
MSPRSMSIFSITFLGNEMPTEILDCIITLLQKIIKRNGESTICKAIYMTSTTAYELNSDNRKKSNSRSGYNEGIDRAVISVLYRDNKMWNGQLKRNVEKSVGLTIPPKTWGTHLKKMQRENYLFKKDTRERNEKVFYSLTKGAKQLKDLMLLRTDPERSVFCQIYTNLFFRAIVEGNTYAGDDLDNILNEIHTSRRELHIKRVHIEKKYYHCYEKPDLTTVPEKRLPALMTTYYKPTSLGVKIIESACYRENIIHKNHIEYTSYTYTVPGVSVQDMAEKYHTFKPRLADCERALELLLKIDLIRPVMDFRGKTRYVIADPKLTDFVTDLYQFSDVENEFLSVKWQYSCGPTLDERLSRKALYSDEKKSEKFFDVRELQRYQFRQSIRERKDSQGELDRHLQEFDRHLQEFEKQRLKFFKYIKEKHHTTVKRYPFLHEIIGVVSPLLLD